MKNKIDKSFAVSGIFLMVMSLFAFSFVLMESEIVSGKYCYSKILSNKRTIPIPGNDCVAAGLLESPPGFKAAVTTTPADKLNVGFNIAPQSATGKIFEGKFLVNGGGTIKEGNVLKVTNIETGVLGNYKIDGKNIKLFKPATGIQNAFATKTINLGGSIGQTTFSNALQDPTLRYEIMNNPDLLKGTGYTGLSQTSSASGPLIPNQFTLTHADGSTQIIDVGSKKIVGGTSAVKAAEQSWFAKTFGAGFGHLIEGVTWAIGVYTAVQFLGSFVGLEEATTDALSTSAFVGIVTWKGALGLAEGAWTKETFSILGEESIGIMSNAAWIGIAAGLITFLLMYKDTDTKIVTFTCVPWQAPTGGQNCEECNKQDLPCSEYQCKSLGQACEIINQGSTEEKCVWVNRQDVNPPIIEPSIPSLLNNYKYSPNNAISPPDRGVKVDYENSEDNCIPAFTPLSFGVKLDEPAKCKIDILRKEKFEDMVSQMSSGMLRYNHTYVLSLPGKEALNAENITLINNGQYDTYVRCEDANGNSNTATFVFSYCVDPGPDTTAPLIVTTSILNNQPIAYNQSSVDLEVYTNEPSSCRWDHNNKDYDSMNEQMACSTSVTDFNAQMLYKCNTELTGLKDKTENNFYFRCQDKPTKPESERNTNAESHKFTLLGTQPLVIDSISPDEETMSDSTDSIKVPIKVRTSSGHNEGESVCYYSDTGIEEDYIKFFETGTFEHTQDLFLTEGFYEYFIRCTDFGGNSDNGIIEFGVETDLDSPQVVRAYKEENFLKLITSEEAQCVYSTFSCNYEFDEGTSITVVDKKNHFADWDLQTNLFVKCQDNFGNKPLPDRCSMSVRANDF